MANKATPFEPVLSSRAAGFLASMSRARQRKLTALLFRLAEHPTQLGDYTTRDELGREIQHLEVGEIVISFWPDHAVRELRITEINNL